MRLLLAALLIPVVGLTSGTMVYVYRRAVLTHETAVARCLDAGGAWLPRSARSFAGTCLVDPNEASGPAARDGAGIR